MRSPLLPCALAVSFSLSSLALGAEKTAQEEPPASIPFEKDQVGGHLQVVLGGGYAAPFGHIAHTVKSTARSGDGWGGMGELSYGLDRSVVVGAYGEYQGLGSSGRCPSCRASSWGGGLFVGYHFVQGLRFDPYVSYGLGYRAISSKGTNSDSSYQGLEWLRLQVGGNWFVLPQLGIGPYLQLGGGTMLGLPNDEEVKGSYWRLQAGIRITLDLPGH